jgi:hypothetical protein
MTHVDLSPPHPQPRRMHKVIPTISALVDFLLRALTPYTIRQVRVLHHLWDFKGRLDDGAPSLPHF